MVRSLDGLVDESLQHRGGEIENKHLGVVSSAQSQVLFVSQKAGIDVHVVQRVQRLLARQIDVDVARGRLQKRDTQGPATRLRDRRPKCAAGMAFPASATRLPLAGDGERPKEDRLPACVRCRSAAAACSEFRDTLPEQASGLEVSGQHLVRAAVGW